MKPFPALYVPTLRPGASLRSMRVHVVDVYEVHERTGRAEIGLWDGPNQYRTLAPIACLATKTDRAHALIARQTETLLNRIFGSAARPPQTAVAGMTAAEPETASKPKPERK